MTIHKTIIIDDEPLARQRLKRLLQLFECIDVIAEAANGKEGLELINALHPDLIFLDIEMPLLNGFEMLSQLSEQPLVVFTTAYDQYAIKAFEENSIDYLLKPIEKERLEKTIHKLQTAELKHQANSQFVQLLQQLNLKKEIRTLTVKTGDKILLIKLQDIFHIEAEEKYVFLRTADGNNHLTDFTITSLEERLPDNFVRIHRRSIINANRIKEIHRSFNGVFVFLMDDLETSRVCSSRGYGEELRQRFEI